MISLSRSAFEIYGIKKRVVTHFEESLPRNGWACVFREAKRNRGDAGGAKDAGSGREPETTRSIPAPMSANIIVVNGPGRSVGKSRKKVVLSCRSRSGIQELVIPASAGTARGSFGFGMMQRFPP
jgi:hypothetical protein